VSQWVDNVERPCNLVKDAFWWHLYRLDVVFDETSCEREI
jgi:hypothetical protein